MTNLTAKELKEIAKELKVKNWWTLNKETLISEIEKLQQPKEEKKPRGKLIEYNGKSQNLHAWARELGVIRQTLYARLYLQGWDVERAFTTPIKKKALD